MKEMDYMVSYVEKYTGEVHSIDGVPVFALQENVFPTAGLVFFFRDGVAYEGENEWGISHFVEHILFRGTKEYPTLYDLSMAVEGGGGRFSAYSTRDVVAYWIKFLPPKEEEALHIMEQMLLYPSIKEEFISSEKAIIYQERQREINNPSFFSSLMVENLLLWPLPLCRHPIGEDEFISQITPAILRDHIARVYNRSNMAVACVGNFSSSFLSQLKNVIHKFPQGEKGRYINFIPNFKWGGKNVVHRVTHHKSQVYLSMGWKFTVKNMKEFYQWRVANALLGAGYTSLLNKLLREDENITYLCTTGLNFYEDVAVFKINLALADKNLEKAIFLIENLLNKVKAGKVNPSIFHKAKIRHAGSLIVKMEDPLEIAKIMGHSLIKESFKFTLWEYIKSISDVSIDGVSSLLKRCLTDENRKIFIQTGSPMVEKVFPNAFKM